MGNPSKDAAAVPYFHREGDVKYKAVKAQQDIDDAYKNGLRDGRQQILAELIEVAVRTDGAGVWQALFLQMFKPRQQ